MIREVPASVLGVEDGVLHQLADVLVLDPVEHLIPLPTGSDQAGEPQFGEVLGDPCRRLADRIRELVHREFTVSKCPQESHPSAVGEHSKHLDGELHLL
jgi:hypothetical protein